MRKTYRDILKHQFHIHLIRTRERLEFTQAEMAEKLYMDERSYAELDHGKSCCSAVTFAVYLLYFCEDVGAFLEELRREFEAGKETAA